MTLQEKINADFLEAYKAHDELRISTLRLIKSALQNAKIALRQSSGSLEEAELPEENVISVLKREAKQRRDSILEFKKAGRNEASSKEEAELNIVESYLPQQYSEEKIREIAADAINSTGATDPSQMGQVIGKIMAEHGANVDGGTVSKIVRELLQK